MGVLANRRKRRKTDHWFPPTQVIHGLDDRFGRPARQESCKICPINWYGWMSRPVTRAVQL